MNVLAKAGVVLLLSVVVATAMVGLLVTTTRLLSSPQLSEEAHLRPAAPNAEQQE